MPPTKPAFKELRAYAARLFGGLYLSAVLCVVLTFVFAVGLGTGNPYILAPFALVVATLGMVFSAYVAERKTNGTEIAPFDFSELRRRTVFGEIPAWTLYMLLFGAMLLAAQYLIGDIADNVLRISVDLPTITLSFVLYSTMAMGMFAPSCLGLFGLHLFIHWLMYCWNPEATHSP